MFKFLLKVFIVINLIFFSITQAEAKKSNTILFIPLDNRPVCDSFSAQAMESANFTILMPPDQFLASRTRGANSAELWKWLEKNANKADSAVISTDALIYGGLVGSRTHNFTAAELNDKVKRFQELTKQTDIKIYGFSTIMRTPTASFGNVEPTYYTDVGPAIFAYSQLYDKGHFRVDSFPEKIRRLTIERNLRKDNLGDWLTRREKNFEINQKLAYLSRTGSFHYFAIGKDDNAPRSHTHMEGQLLALRNMDLTAKDFQILPGVDQLGLLLLTRSVMDNRNLKPTIYPFYVDGVGPNTIPQYSDMTLGKSVPQQIIAAGGIVANSIAGADIILALNTPYDGIMQDTTAPSNQFFASPENKRYIGLLKGLLLNNKSISLADIAYSNGADNGFMNEVAKQGLLTKLVAYNGWNTADNTVGFAIAQGILAPMTTKDNQLQLMRERVIDDWYYQANARREINKILAEKQQTIYRFNLGSHAEQFRKEAFRITKDLAAKYDLTENTVFNLTFPWNRLFEAEVTDIHLDRNKRRK